MDNFYGPLSVRLYMTPYLNWEKLGGGRGVTRKERGIPLCCPSPDYRRFVNLVYEYTYQRNETVFFPWLNSTDFVFQKVPEAIQSKIVYFYSVINELRSRDVHSMRNKILRSCLMTALMIRFWIPPMMLSDRSPHTSCASCATLEFFP